MKVAEHLEAFHKRAAEHHRNLSRLHKAHASSCEAEHEQRLHESLADQHESFAQHHEGSAQACAKAVSGELSKVAPMPAGASAIIRKDTPQPTIVTRHGQRDPNTAKTEVPDALENFA